MHIVTKQTFLNWLETQKKAKKINWDTCHCPMARYAIDNLNAELPRAGSQEVVDISGEVLYRLSGFTFYNFYQTSIYDFSLPRTYGELASVLKNQIAIANAHY